MIVWIGHARNAGNHPSTIYLDYKICRASIRSSRAAAHKARAVHGTLSQTRASDAAMRTTTASPIALERES